MFPRGGGRVEDILAKIDSIMWQVMGTIPLPASVLGAMVLGNTAVKRCLPRTGQPYRELEPREGFLLCTVLCLEQKLAVDGINCQLHKQCKNNAVHSLTTGINSMGVMTCGQGMVFTLSVGRQLWLVR